MYTLLCGSPPFTGTTETEIIKKIQKGELKFDSEVSADLSENCQALILKLLNPNPEERPTAAQILGNNWIISPDNSRPIAKEALMNFKTFRVNFD